MGREEKIKHLAENCGYKEDLLKNSPDELIDQMYEHETEEPEKKPGEMNDAEDIQHRGEAQMDEGDAPAGDHPGGASVPDENYDKLSPGGKPDKFARGGGAGSSQSKAMWAKVSDSGVGRKSKGGDYNKGAMHGNWAELAEGDEPDPDTKTVMGDDDGDPDPAEMDDEERAEMAEHFASKFRKYKHYKHGDTERVSTPERKEAMSSYRETGQLIAREVAKQVGMAMARIEKSAGSRIAKVEKFAERRIAAEIKATASAKFNELVRRGIVLPAQVPALMRRALAADASTVRKFSEKNAKGQTIQVERTAFDQFFREMEDWPEVARFAERAKSPEQKSQSSEDAEVAKVERGFESFSEKFPKSIKKADIVDGFKAEKKNHPDLTAEQFLQGLSIA